MTKRFSKVSPAVWRSRRFMSLPDSDAKLLYLYFVTSEHQTSIGAYVIPTGYAIADLAWDASRYESARTALVDAELVAFDEEASTVYVERWFKNSPQMNESPAQGCQRLISELESSTIADKVQDDFEEAEARRYPIPPQRSANVTPACMDSLNRRGFGVGK